MTTIDAHAHVFPRIRGRIGDGPVIGLQYGRAAVGEGSVQVLPPLNAHVVHSPSMLIAAMDLVGVDRAVLLQGPFYGYCNAYVNAAATGFRDRFAAAIAIDPWKDGRQGFEKACEIAVTARAFKLEFSERTGLSGLHRDAHLGAADIAWLWEELEARQLVLVIDLGHIGGRGYQTEAVRAIAVSHPHLRIVIAHLAQPNPTVVRDRAARSTWLEQVSLGLLQNVWFDTASLPVYFARERSYHGLADCLRWAVEAIGSDRIMWGSDIPATLPSATYQQLHDVVAEGLDFLGSASRQRVFGDTALQVFWGEDRAGPKGGRVQ
ncbi:MAG: amidohydrolase family protein [Acidimicrobiales bacterium]